MTAKKLFMICLLLAGLFCLPAEAQHPGEAVSPQTIRKLGEKHFFSLSPISDDIFRLMRGRHTRRTVPWQEANCDTLDACMLTRTAETL